MEKPPKKQCGAKNRQGEPCKKPPLKGKTRCKLHGGKSVSGKNSKVYTHGIYSNLLTADELAMHDAISARLSSVDDEINLIRFRIIRAQKAEQEERLNNTMHVDEIKTVTGGDFANTTTTARRTDWGGIIDRLMGRLGQLMKLRMELLTAKGDPEFTAKSGEDVVTAARRISDALREIEGAVTDVPHQSEDDS